MHVSVCLGREGKGDSGREGRLLEKQEQEQEREQEQEGLLEEHVF